MESITELFSGLSETLKTNIVPIAIVLGVILLVVGWMFYNSKVTSVKEDYTEAAAPDSVEEEEAEADDGGENEQRVEESPTE